MRAPRSTRILASILALALALVSAPPSWAQSRDDGGEVPKTSELEIEVLGESGEALAGVTVAAEHVESGGSPVLADSDAGGVARFEGMPYGHYVFSFRTSAGRAYVGNRALLVGPERDEEGLFRLGPFQPGDEKLGLVPGMEVPAFSAAAAGVARLDEDFGPTGWAWLRTGRGVAVVVGAGTLVVAALIATAEDDEETLDQDVSPSEAD